MTIAQGAYGELPKTPTAKSTAPASAASLTWAVQVGTFENTQQAANFINERGLQTLGAEVDDWNQVYRVVVRGENSTAAKAMLARVKSLGIGDAFFGSRGSAIS